MFLLSLSKCIFLYLFTSHQWRMTPGKCGLNGNSTLPHGKEGLRLNMYPGPPVLRRTVSRHISPVTLLVSWKEKLPRLLATPCPRRLPAGAPPGGTARRGRGCLPAKSGNTSQAAKRCAENNSTLRSLAPRAPWQGRNPGGWCYRRSSFEVSKPIIRIDTQYSASSEGFSRDFCFASVAHDDLH